MPKSSAFAHAYLRLIFNNVGIPNIGDATGLRGSVVAGSLWVALHTSDPGIGGSQETFEAEYTGYARKQMLRGSAFVVTDNVVSPAAHIDFPQCTAAPGDPLTHWSVGTYQTGAGYVLYTGEISPSILVSVNTIPRLENISTITEL